MQSISLHSLTKVNAQNAILHGKLTVFEANFSQNKILGLFWFFDAYSSGV